MNAALPPGWHTAAHRSTTPPVPPLHNTLPSPHAQLPSALSPLARSFSPPPLPTPSSTSTPEDEVPLLYDVSLRHLLPHARLSFEEQRWVHYSESGGPFPSHGSSKKRLQPPSPAWGSPSSAVVGCIVNERRARAAVPPPHLLQSFLPRAGASAHPFAVVGSCSHSTAPLHSCVSHEYKTAAHASFPPAPAWVRPPDRLLTLLPTVTPPPFQPDRLLQDRPPTPLH